jgi:hypothetical protein
VKAGKIDFKVDKAGIIHAVIGKASFDAAKAQRERHELLQTLVKLKPSTAKGAYIMSIYHEQHHGARHQSGYPRGGIRTATGRPLGAPRHQQKKMATRAEKDQAIAELIGGDQRHQRALPHRRQLAWTAESTSATCAGPANKGGVRMKVVKNTLLRKAMERVEGKDYSGLFPTLAGQTAVLFAEKGNAPAKLIKDFRKKRAKNSAPQLKSAWIDEAVFVGDDQLVMLSELKGREELIGEIIGLLQSPHEEPHQRPAGQRWPPQDRRPGEGPRRARPPNTPTRFGRRMVRRPDLQRVTHSQLPNNRK